MLSVIVDYCLTHGKNSNPTADEKSNKFFSFFYSKEIIDTDSLCINVYPLIRDYPKNISEKIDRILLKLSRILPHAGLNAERNLLSNEQLYCETSIIARNISNCSLHGKTYDDKELFYEAYREINTILIFMTNLDYIKLDLETISFTYNGWLRVEELIRERASINQGFIAMKFGDDTKFIREAFRTAIQACDYSPQFIDEKEHNNQIVPEIFFEIERSKFLVVDVTYPNYGAYYEAGYGLALKKEVIFCCRDKEFKADNSRPHFDIAQKAMVVWENTDELIEKLKKRIEATVGLNN
jgi:nucleoside 2-deoxyribosyltransferase